MREPQQGGCGHVMRDPGVPLLPNFSIVRRRVGVPMAVL